jgi:hypothetical protein
MIVGKTVKDLSLQLALSLFRIGRLLEGLWMNPPSTALFS